MFEPLMHMLSAFACVCRSAYICACECVGMHFNVFVCLMSPLYMFFCTTSLSHACKKNHHHITVSHLQCTHPLPSIATMCRYNWSICLTPRTWRRHLLVDLYMCSPWSPVKSFVYSQNVGCAADVSTSSPSPLSHVTCRCPSCTGSLLR